MNWLKKHVGIIIFCLVILLIVMCYILFGRNIGINNNSEENLSLKHYQDNEYIPVNITTEAMAKIYLQEYVHKLQYNLEEAYELLDENYRINKFGSYENFVNYINSIMTAKTREVKVTKFAVTDSSGYRYYDVYDSNNNLFIFKEKGVLQYSVFFDRFTVKV